MINYSIKVKNAAGDSLGEFQNFRNLRFGKRLNNFGTCSFDIPAIDPTVNSLTALRIYTVWIYRTDESGTTLVWAGEQALRKGELTDDGNNWVTIVCYDWLEQLEDRYTAALVTFEGIDAGQIAWELIDTSQSQPNGDFGITEGSIEATIERDRTYYNQNIKEALINLANVISGFDFEITNEKVFNIYSVMGTDKSDSIVLEYGFNIKNVTITEDFTQPVNRAIVLGEATGETELSRVESDDVAAQTLNKVREGLLAEMSVSELNTLAEKGESMIRKYGTALITIEQDLLPAGGDGGPTPSIDDFGLGDEIRLRVQAGIYDIDSSYRIFEWEIEFDSANTEKLKLVLGDFTL